MEPKKRRIQHRRPVCLILSWCVLVSLCMCLVNGNEEDEKETLSVSDELTPESLIDKDINNIDDPKKTTNYGGYIVGRIVDSLTMLSYKSFLPYNNMKDVARMYSVKTDNRTFSLYEDNSVWDGLFSECGKNTSLNCVKRNVFEYLNRTIVTAGDFHVTDSLIFTKSGNELIENKYDRNLNNVSYHHDNRTSVNGSENSEQRSFYSFRGLTDVLYEKGVNFIMTHDLVLQLPEMVFGGAVVRISPKGVEEDGGAMFKLEVNQGKNDSGESRIFFKKQKKKLMMAFFALLMVIKMIKVKLLFLVPMLLGVGTAKKLFLKLLLFIFPAFAHIFKFCAYYHAAHTKFHHHHHQIAHHHHHVPVPVPVHVDHSHTVHVDHQSPPPQHYGPNSWDSSAPDYISSRNEYLSPTQENELESWGLMSKGAFHVPAAALNSDSQSLAYSAYDQFLDDQRVSRSALTVTEPASIFLPPKPETPARFDPNIISPPKQYPSPPYVSNQQQELLLHQLNNKQQNIHFEGHGGIQQHKTIRVVDPTAVAENKQAKLHQEQLLLEQQKYQQLLRQQEALRPKNLTPRPPAEGTTVQVAYDPFYSPILQKMDNVFVQLGFNEEACRERLVCSMYKTPSRFSPHSNLISAELSRDAHELQKPVVPNSASVRFQRYVQAARDGQEQKECLRLYPACTVKTE